MKNRKTKKDHLCQICGASGNKVELRPGVIVRPVVCELIRKETGSWDENGWICTGDLRKYRHKFVEELLKTERGELTALKAELEIRNLHQKIDHLMSHQWERLLEIQDVQMELINELQHYKGDS